jgi:hypothetical protein
LFCAVNIAPQFAPFRNSAVWHRRKSPVTMLPFRGLRAALLSHGRVTASFLPRTLFTSAALRADTTADEIGKPATLASSASVVPSYPADEEKPVEVCCVVTLLYTELYQHVSRCETTGVMCCAR